MLSKPKIPDLDRAALLGFLGERYCNHDTSSRDNGNEFNALSQAFQCATYTNIIQQIAQDNQKNHLSPSDISDCDLTSYE